MKILLVALALLLSPLSQAATLRCGSGLITSDDHLSEVQSKCGEPVTRQFLGYREVIDYYGGTTQVPIKEWSYGPRNGMYYYLRFEANRLINVESKRGQ